jgi:hypothetical protein
MKCALSALLVCICFAGGLAYAKSEGRTSWRVADALNACVINCASDSDSCKRLCPATYNGPCISACDNQAQFCRQNCQRR